MKGKGGWGEQQKPKIALRIPMLANCLGLPRSLESYLGFSSLVPSPAPVSALAPS